MYKRTDSPFIFQPNPKVFGGNLYLNSTPATKFYLDTNILAIEAFTNSYNYMACLLKYIFGRILGVEPTKAFPRTCFNSRPPHVHSHVKQPAWKYATTEWLVVRFLHRLQQEVGQIMDSTIPQQMCITQDRLGFKVNGSGGYELSSCLADLDGQQYLFQIRITLYNFTPRHRTFTVSAISDDICSSNSVRGGKQQQPSSAGSPI
ncbi:uncharacterized protein LOC106404579 isoform X2 [Brassica napus]|uniref:uncharacterized protein LOC106404579 isoform X2 n=1 Tax=Brassica napus TaxID=3708 RepID=UPI00207A89EB|nr:uncharacterized protein LOC106404579 isoform X2 [Brassica napus]